MPGEGHPQGEPAPQPASAPQPAPRPQPAPAPQPQRFHVHHSYIWLNVLEAAVLLLFLGLLSALSMLLAGLAAGEGSGAYASLAFVGFAVGVCLLLLIAIALGYWWSWRHLYYELGPEEFTLCSGIFNKERVSVPYRRIQSVDQHASLTQRIFGVCTVTIDTAGGAANKAVVLPYLRRSQAEELRRELYARKSRAEAVPPAPASAGAPAPAPQLAPAPARSNILDAPAGLWNSVPAPFAGRPAAGQPATGRPAAAQPASSPAVGTSPAAPAGAAGAPSPSPNVPSFEFGLSNKELLFTGLSNNTAFVLVLLSLIGGIVQVASMFVTPASIESAELLEDAAMIGLQLLGSSAIFLVAAGLVIVAAILWLFSALGTCISYGGFRARRCGRRIEVERGLFQHRVQSVDVDRVVYVKVSQGFIRRLLGYCEISLGKVDAVDIAGQVTGSSEAHSVVVHPFVRLDQVPQILAGLIPEFSGAPTRTTRVAPVALRRGLIRRCILQGKGFWLAIAVFVVQLLGHLFLDAGDVMEGYALSCLDSAATVGYVVCAVLFVLDVVGTVLWFQDSGFSCNQRFMQVDNGGFTRETVSFKRAKLQYARVRTNPFQRRAHTATICASTAAGVGSTSLQLVDVGEEDADAWLDWSKPRGNVLSWRL